MTTIIEQLFAEMQEARDAKAAAEFRADQAEYEVFIRAKYSTDDKKAALTAGHAMPNANGDPSYVIKDKEDLANAIKAVGRGSADHDAIRKHVIKRATALGLASMIPDNWDTMTGALKDATQSNDSNEEIEEREDNADAQKDCPTCGGDGKIMAGHRTCPDCKGSGSVPADFDSDSRSQFVPVATWVDETTAEVTRNIHNDPDHRSAPEDIEDRVNAQREQQVIREILSLPEEQREEMIDAAPDPDEIRAAVASYNDIEKAVENALASAFGQSGDYCDIWVCDAGDNGTEERWAVFQSYIDPPGQGTFKVTFNCSDDGAVTFTSNPVPVARVTTYEPVPAPVAPDLTDKSMAAVTAARDADLIALERERDADAEIRAKVVRSTKRSK